jgi:hypothetical protein
VLTEDGITVHPLKYHPDAIQLKRFEKRGIIADTSFDQPMRVNKRFVRALHKIAFELLCFDQGPEYVLDHRFDPVREYIRYGRGHRSILLDKGPVDIREKRSLGLYQFPGTQDRVAQIAVFFVDLSPENHIFENADGSKLAEERFVRWSDRDGN